jgi:hypothetical protein
MQQLIRHNPFEQSGNQSTRLLVYRMVTTIQGQLQYWQGSSRARMIKRSVIK